MWGAKSERFATQDVRDVNLARVAEESLIASRSGKTIFRAPVSGPLRFQLPEHGLSAGLDLDKDDALELVSLIQSQLSDWRRFDASRKAEAVRQPPLNAEK